MDLVDILIDITERYPRRHWVDEFRKALAQAEQTSRIADSFEVKTGKTTFKPVAEGKQPSTGKAFTVYELADGTTIKSPLLNGRPITDDELRETVSRWNKEAADIVRQSMPGQFGGKSSS